MSEAAVEIMREHRARMRAISDRGLELTTSLATFNIRQIMSSGNAHAHPNVQTPVEAIDALTDLIKAPTEGSP